MTTPTPPLPKLLRAAACWTNPATDCVEFDKAFPEWAGANRGQRLSAALAAAADRLEAEQPAPDSGELQRLRDLHWRRGIALILLSPTLILFAPVAYGYWIVRAVFDVLRRIVKDIRGAPRAYADLWITAWTGRNPEQERIDAAFVSKHWRRQKAQGADRG